jgi:hypothetical protein
MGKQLTEDVKEGIRACISDKKNPDKCIDKVLEENDIDHEQKSKILTKMMKEES